MGTAAKLGLPPGYRFVPTDEELVGDYLLPRILGQALPANDIREVDPLSAPPSVLVDDRHRKGGDSFFFAYGQPMNARGGRQKRTCVGGGTWEGQGKQKKRVDAAEAADNKKLLRVVAVQPETAEPVVAEIGWEKRAFNFHEDPDRGSTGWVMHEYSITAPPSVAASLMRVYRVRFSGHGKIAQQKRKRDAQQRCVDDEDDDGEIVQADDGGAPQRATTETATRYAAAMEEFEHAAAASTFVVGGEVPAPAAEYTTFAPQHQELLQYHPPPAPPQTEATTIVYYPTVEEEGQGYAAGVTTFVGQDGRYYYAIAPQHEPIGVGAPCCPVEEDEYRPPCAPQTHQPATASIFVGEDGCYYCYTFAPPQQPPPDQHPSYCSPAVDAYNNGGGDLADRTELPALVDAAVDGDLVDPTEVPAAAAEDVVVDGNPAADGTTVVDAGADRSAVPSPREWCQEDAYELEALLATTPPSHDELFSDINVDD